MKAVILAGGLGTRISEETSIKPKPMVEIGGMPILWHIMKIYYSQGVREFVVCCGYKGYIIKEFFANYWLRTSNLTFHGKSRPIEIHENGTEDWIVTLVDTGDSSMTGGRLKRVKKYLGNSTFCLTYGDGVGNINIKESIKFHRQHGSLATLTAVQPTGRFGAFAMHENQSTVEHFREKPEGDNAWINGGYFVLEPEVIDYIDGDATVWEKEPLEQLASEGQLNAFKHNDFWHPMDTIRDKSVLEDLWDSGEAPWKSW
jgi:glucose-1-phosphate cytidylyltransferase